jgi:hypothetical protein
MIRSVDTVIARWKSLMEDHAGNNRDHTAPTLRDAALVTAIRRVADVALQRDIWL